MEKDDRERLLQLRRDWFVLNADMSALERRFEELKDKAWKLFKKIDDKEQS